MLRRLPPLTRSLPEEIDELDDEVMRYGRAVETVIAARAAGCFLPSPQPDGAQIVRLAGRLERDAVGDPAEHDRARALHKVAGHLRELDRAAAGPCDDDGLDVVAAALTAALDVFARPDIPGLVNLQNRVDLLSDHVERQRGLREVAVHLLGIGAAAEFAWANHPGPRREPVAPL